MATRCPTYGTSQRQMFNPIIGYCTENKKLPLDGQCQLYRQCLVVESVSPFGKWQTVSCESGQHFDQEFQNCIPSNISTCGKLKFFFNLQAITIKKNKCNCLLFHKKIVVKNPCIETTCQNGGTCYADSLSFALCFCKEGFGGKLCEIDKRPTATTTTTTKATTASSSKLNSFYI